MLAPPALCGALELLNEADLDEPTGMSGFSRGAIGRISCTLVESHRGRRRVGHGQLHARSAALGDPSLDRIQKASPDSFSASIRSDPHSDDAKELSLRGVAHRRDDAYGLVTPEGKKGRRVVSCRAARCALGPCLSGKGGFPLVRRAKGTWVCSEPSQSNPLQERAVESLNPPNHDLVHGVNSSIS